MKTGIERFTELAVEEQARERRNLTVREAQALGRLSKDASLIIKPADKGGATVVMNRAGYVLACERQLADTKFYSSPAQSDDFDFAVRTKLILERMHRLKMISAQTLEYCGTLEGKARPFYGLPKIHKEPEKWVDGVPPMRPIVSDCPSATNKAAKLLDTFLQPISVTHESYIKDTPDFISKITSVQLPEKFVLATADVEALYTNIPHGEGIEAVRKALARQGAWDPSQINAICDLLRLDLEGNNFVFNGKTYHQEHGTAMGRAWAPAYANIFMAEWERKLAALNLVQPFLWYRFIDDVFAGYPDSSEKWNEYIEKANSVDPNIKLTTTVSEKEVEFLDLRIFEQDGKLEHRLFRKPTDTLQFVRADSNHHPTTFRGVATSQFLRVMRNCSLQVHRDFHCKELRDAFRARGYSKRTLRKAYSRAVELFQGTEKRQPVPRGCVLALPYHPAIADLPKAVAEMHQTIIWDTLSPQQAIQAMTNGVTGPPLVAWKRGRNLRDILVRAKL